MRDNIFQDVVNNENAFTELLCNLLKFHELRDVFFEYLKLSDNENFDYGTQFKTKESQKNGRPDFYICSEKYFIFIEIKINDTGLTKNQPKGYIKELNLKDYKDKKKHLYFIVPENYKYRDKLERFKKKYANTLIEIFEWEKYFGKLIENKIWKNNDILKEYYKFIKNKFGYENLLFKEGDMEQIQDCGQHIKRVQDAIDEVVNEVISKKVVYKTKFMKNSVEIIYEIYDKKKKKVLGYFGTWFDVWANNKNVICLFLEELRKYRDDIEKIRHVFDYIDKDDDNTHYEYVCFDEELLNGNYNENLNNFYEDKLKPILTICNTEKTKKK